MGSRRLILWCPEEAWQGSRNRGGYISYHFVNMCQLDQHASDESSIHGILGGCGWLCTKKRVEYDKWRVPSCLEGACQIPRNSVRGVVAPGSLVGTTDTQHMPAGIRGCMRRRAVGWCGGQQGESLPTVMENVPMSSNPEITPTISDLPVAPGAQLVDVHEGRPEWETLSLPLTAPDSDSESEKSEFNWNEIACEKGMDSPHSQSSGSSSWVECEETQHSRQSSSSSFVNLHSRVSSTSSFVDIEADILDLSS